MAKQDIIISIKINDSQAKKGADGAAKSLSKVEKAQEALNFELSEAGKEYAKLKAATDDQRLANNLAAKSAVDLAKGIKQGRAQSGLNNAILLETGRLASDASYGFTAIANNLSQVVTLFSSFAKTAGGVGASLKQLGASLIGTGGLLIALQLIISFGPQIFDFFARLLGVTRELRDAMKGAADTIKQQTGAFELYTRTLQNGWKSSEEMADATKMLKKEFPEYIKLLKDAGLSTEDLMNGNKEAIAITKEYTKEIKRMAMARQAAIKIEEEAAKIIQVEVDREVKAREKGFTSVKDVQERLKISEEELQRVRDRNSNKTFTQLTDLERKEQRGIEARIKNYKKILELNQDEVDDAEKTIDILMEFTDIQVKDDEKAGRSRKRRAKIFKEADRDYEKELAASQQRIQKLEANHQEDLILIEIEGMVKRAEIKQKEFEEDQARRIRDFILSDATLEEKKEAERRYNNSIATSRESLYDYLIQLDEEYIAKLDDLESTRELEDLAEFGRALQKFNTERLKFQEEYLKSYTDSEIDRVEVAKLIEQDRFNNVMANLRAERNAKIALGETTEAIDQKIRNAQATNTENNVALAEQERDAKIGIANQVGEAIVAVAGEGSSVGKAASVAMAIMNTREAFTAALGAKPYGPWNIAQAAAVLAMGFKQVKDIMAVKIPGKDPSTGGAGGGINIQAPDFNIVGASQTSQLAQAVTTQQDRPVKAFVVGKDISTQQELDRNITNTASFG